MKTFAVDAFARSLDCDELQPYIHRASHEPAQISSEEGCGFDGLRRTFQGRDKLHATCGGANNHSILGFFSFIMHQIQSLRTPARNVYVFFFAGERLDSEKIASQQEAPEVQVYEWVKRKGGEEQIKSDDYSKAVSGQVTEL